MSFTGRMHLFIGLQNSRNVRFDRLLAWNGFEVTAEKKDGQVAFVEIKSLAGETCRFKNPWHPHPPRVILATDNVTVPIRIDGDTVSFDTRPNERYKVSDSQSAGHQGAKIP
jgi:hypothetical protein